MAEIGHQRISATSAKSLLIRSLEAIESARPGTLNRLAQDKGRTKRIVARRQEDFYDNTKLRHLAEELDGRWWVATNNSFDETVKFLRRAGFHAGLDVEVRRYG